MNVTLTLLIRFDTKCTRCSCPLPKFSTENGLDITYAKGGANGKLLDCKLFMWNWLVIVLYTWIISSLNVCIRVI